VVASREGLPEFKATYLKKQMELLVATSVLIYDIKRARRKSILLRLYYVAVVKDAPDSGKMRCTVEYTISLCRVELGTAAEPIGSILTLDYTV